MKKSSIIPVLLMALLCQPLVSQTDATGQTNSWEFFLEPYLMFPNMDGTTGLGALPDAPVSANPGDIFDKLQIGTMLYAEASTGNWHFGSDLIYMKLKQDLEPGVVIANGKVIAKQFAWEGAGLYSITSWLDVGLGGTINSLKLETDINVNEVGGGTSNRSRKLSQTWFDPMLIARTGSKPGSKFIYRFRGEIGGFGIGSKFAWQLQANAGYRFSKLFQLTAGYRLIGVNYEKNNSAEGVLNNNRFLYDVNTFGPEIRLGFTL